MRTLFHLCSRLLPALCGLAVLGAQAQNPAPSPAPSAPEPKARSEQQVERIRHEDEGARIDELRVGGETRAITVSPKGAAPAYEVPPEGNNRNPASSERERSGAGGWKLLNF